jgi:glycosidase
LLDFPLFYPIRHAFAEAKNLDEVPKLLSKDFLYTNPNTLVTLLGGHDDGRFMSEKGATIAGLKLANAFVLTTRGVPQLYYGDEIAMTGADEPTTRGDFPGGFPGDRRNAFTAGGRTREENELWDYVKKLNNLHTSLEPLKVGTLVNLHVSEQQYAYARTTNAGSVVIALNNASTPAQMQFDVTRAGVGNGALLSDRLGTGTDVRVANGKIAVNLPARSASIYVPR